MKPIDTKAIRARADAATAGPWRRIGSLSLDSCVLAGAPHDITMNVDVQSDDARADAEFIASARADVPVLCDAVDERDAEIARLRAELAALRGAVAAFVEADTEERVTIFEAMAALASSEVPR